MHLCRRIYCRVSLESTGPRRMRSREERHVYASERRYKWKETIAITRTRARMSRASAMS